MAVTTTMTIKTNDANNNNEDPALENLLEATKSEATDGLTHML